MIYEDDPYYNLPALPQDIKITKKELLELENHELVFAAFFQPNNKLLCYVGSILVQSFIKDLDGSCYSSPYLLYQYLCNNNYAEQIRQLKRTDFVEPYLGIMNSAINVLMDYYIYYPRKSIDKDYKKMLELAHSFFDTLYYYDNKDRAISILNSLQELLCREYPLEEI